MKSTSRLLMGEEVVTDVNSEPGSLAELTEME
jgi:hypothetical protein